MRVCTLGIVLLGVILSFGSTPFLQPPAHAAWARLSSLRKAPRRPPARAPRLRVTVTAYSLQGKTASGRRARRGIVALSRDVEQILGVTFGTHVLLEGLGTFVFEDRVSARHRRHADIFVASPQAARRWYRKGVAVRVLSAAPSMAPPRAPPAQRAPARLGTTRTRRVIRVPRIRRGTSTPRQDHTTAKGRGHAPHRRRSRSH